MNTVIIDYGSGNLRSAAKAFERMSREGGIDHQTIVSDEPAQVAMADRIVLPGVGAFDDCMAGLGKLDGMVEALREAVLDSGRPFLSICVGMQLLATVGREHGDHAGLGWVGGEVVALEPSDPTLKVPHMGWNTLRMPEGKAHPVLDGISEGTHAYFVHSYHFRVDNPAHVLADTEYGGPIAAIIGHDNIIATQFHPEKSQAAGLRLISNFLDWKP